MLQISLINLLFPSDQFAWRRNILISKLAGLILFLWFLIHILTICVTSLKFQCAMAIIGKLILCSAILYSNILRCTPFSQLAFILYTKKALVAFGAQFIVLDSPRFAEEREPSSLNRCALKSAACRLIGMIILWPIKVVALI